MSDLFRHDDEMSNTPRRLPPPRPPSQRLPTPRGANGRRAAARPAMPASAVMPKALGLDPKSTLFRGTRTSESVTDISISMVGEVGENGTDLMVDEVSVVDDSMLEEGMTLEESASLVGPVDEVSVSADAHGVQRKEPAVDLRPSARPTVKGLGRLPTGAPPTPSAAETKASSYTTDMSLDWEEEEDATLVRDESSRSDPPPASSPAVMSNDRASAVSRGAGGFVPPPAASDEAPTMPTPGVLFNRAQEDSDGAIELSIEDISAADLDDDIDVDECPTAIPPRAVPAVAHSATPSEPPASEDNRDRSRDSLADTSGVSQLFVDAPQPALSAQRADEDVLTGGDETEQVTSAHVRPPEAAVFEPTTSDAGPVVRKAARPVHPPPRPRPTLTQGTGTTGTGTTRPSRPMIAAASRPGFPELRVPPKSPPSFPPALPPIPTLRPLPEVKSPPRKVPSEPPVAEAAVSPIPAPSAQAQMASVGSASVAPVSAATPPVSASSAPAAEATVDPVVSYGSLPKPSTPPRREPAPQSLPLPPKAPAVRPATIPSLPPMSAPPRSDRAITQRRRGRGGGAPIGALLGGLALAASIVIAVLALWPRHGELIVEVKTPDGDAVQVAEVFVDGKKHCDASPCVIRDMQPGTKLVQVMAPNHSSDGPVRATVEAGDERAVTVTLEPKAGGLTATSNQTVHLFLDGEDRGTLPMSLSGLKPGKHSVELRSEGFIAQAREVNIRAGSKLNLGEITLEKLPAGTDDASADDVEPEKTTATVSKAVASPTPASKASPKPSKKKDEPKAQPADVEPATGNGTLNINSIPVSRVLVDGQPMGETPRVNISLPAGTHTVTFVHPELGKKSVTVKVKPGKTATAAVKLRK